MLIDWETNLNFVGEIFKCLNLDREYNLLQIHDSLLMHPGSWKPWFEGQTGHLSVETS